MRKVSFSIFLVFVFNLSAFAYTVMPAEKISIIKGYTRAVNSMTVSAETAGRLVNIYAGMGHVSRGGVFAVIDPVFTELDIKSVEASIAKVEASKARIKNSVEYYKKEYNRVDSLYKNDAETESRLDSALYALEQAELSLGELEAESMSLKARLSQLKEKLDRHYIHIPKGWTITSKPLEKGEMVSPGQPIATVADFSRLVVPVFLSNEEMKYLQSKDTFKVKIDGKEETAKLNRVNPSFDERTRKREAEVLLDMEGIGGLVTEIPVRVKADGYMISEKALINRYSNPRVKVKSTGEEVRVSILSIEDGTVMIADNPQLSVGTELEVAQ